MEDFKELFKKYWIILVGVLVYFMFGTKKKRRTRRRSKRMSMRMRRMNMRRRR